MFASLDYESRFFGKEIVGLFANRLGRSGSAVILAIMTSTLPHFNSRAPTLLVCMSSLWFIICYQVVQLLHQGRAKVKSRWLPSVVKTYLAWRVDWRLGRAADQLTSLSTEMVASSLNNFEKSLSGDSDRTTVEVGHIRLWPAFFMLIVSTIRISKYGLCEDSLTTTFTSCAPVILF